LKTLHVSLSVKSIPDSVSYYSTLFGRKPDVLKPEFAKWWLDDPKVNFALNAGSGNPGPAGTFAEEGDTECCYAQSTKGWASDPQNVSWELFKTTEYLHDAPTQPKQACPTDCCA